MSNVYDKLIEEAEQCEANALALRKSAALFFNKAGVAALEAFPKKLKQATAMRAAVRPRKNSHINPHGSYLKLAAPLLKNPNGLPRPKFLEEMAKAGRDGRGIGVLVATGLMRTGARVMLTRKGHARAAELLGHEPIPKEAKRKPAKPAPAPGGTLATIVELLGKSTMSKTLFSAALTDRGIDPRGNIATMVKHHYIKRTGKGYSVTAKGLRHANGPLAGGTRKHVAKHGASSNGASSNGTNGHGKRDAIEYVAELLKVNGPMTGPAILAKAKDDGKSITAQTLGAARRYHVIAADGPRGKNRLYNAPA